jgi:hypothetical protein
MRTTRTLSELMITTVLAVGLLGGLAVAPASAGNPNLLKNGGFEQPKVSGAVDEPPGTTLGKCGNGAPYPGPDYHCWLVGSGDARLIHDDFLIGGVAVKPKAGKQFVALIGSMSPSGGYVPGEVQQATSATPNSVPILKFSYATMPTAAAATSSVHVVAQACNNTGTACVTRVDAIVSSASTGNPAAMGWKTFISRVQLNVDESLVKVSVASSPGTVAPTTGDPAVDAFSLK